MIDAILMMIVLSVVQSATEFLPVSSSAHLILSSQFGFTNQSLPVDVALHAGTLLAVIIYFAKDFYYMTTRLFESGPDQRLACNIIIATIPIAILGPFWALIIVHFHNPLIIAGTSIFYGILLWVVDVSFHPKTTLYQMTWKEAVCVGLAQVLALVPGTSRSGITITCCRALGFSRRDSARFSMMLSVPTILGAAAYILWESAQMGSLDQFMTKPVFMGIFLSATLGLLIIYALMEWIKHASYAIFALYRIILGVFVLYYYFL